MQMTTRWLTMKEWRMTEAERKGVDQTTVAHWLADGKYPKLKLKRINPRVVKVRV